MVAVARQKDFSTIDSAEFAADALAGLRATPKRMSPKYFYDAEGSQLFETITQTPEYYPTRAEMEALHLHAKDLAALIPEGAALVEFGSGSSRKARVLLAAAPPLACYVPVDISPEMLEQEAAALRRDVSGLNVLPVVADFTKPFALPKEAVEAPARVGFFPGSTIGNFEPHEAATFLRHAGEQLGSNAVMIVGVDLVKDAGTLTAAYNDRQGVTAAFNLNLLKRMNRELGANFQLDQFEHHAVFNRERSRIEMHLASLVRQKVRIAGEIVDFRAGETIHTENSYKYSVASFGALARGTGWAPVAAFTDGAGLFSIQTFRRIPALRQDA